MDSLKTKDQSWYSSARDITFFIPRVLPPFQHLPPKIATTQLGYWVTPLEAVSVSEGNYSIFLMLHQPKMSIFDGLGMRLNDQLFFWCIHAWAAVAQGQSQCLNTGSLLVQFPWSACQNMLGQDPEPWSAATAISVQITVCHFGQKHLLNDYEQLIFLSFIVYMKWGSTGFA